MIIPKQYFILLLGLSFIPVYADVTFQNVDFAFDDFNLNVTTPVTVDEFHITGLNFNTTSGESFRLYSFDNSTHPDVRWIDQTSTYANFTITDVVSNLRGNVSGTELGSVELDQVSISWTYATINIVDIDNAVLVEYFFPAVIPQTSFNAIILSLNSPEFDRLGGVFAITCPANHTLTGLLTNGTLICTSLDDFFP